MHQIHIVKMMFEYFSNGWLGGGLEKWRLKLSQFPTKLKLKLKLSLANEKKTIGWMS